MSISKNKTESISITALRSVVDYCDKLDHSFNEKDKDASWDGFITVYKNKAIDKKSNIDDKVPVQIKGHTDKTGKYLFKHQIKYSVNIEDLNVYYNDRGVLYFQIFISNDKKNKAIYYSSLFPSKIKGLLRKVEESPKKKSINITFNKLEDKQIYNVVKQFSQESRRQGSGLGQIVPKTIFLKDMNKIKTITATAIGANNEFELFEGIIKGDVCLYSVVGSEKFLIPIDGTDAKYIFDREIKNEIRINDNIYYESYKYHLTSDDEEILIISDNVSVNLNKRLFQLTPRTSIESVIYDCQFLMACIENNYIVFGNKKVYLNFHDDIIKFKNSIVFFLILGNILKKIKFEIKEHFSQLSEEKINSLNELVQIYNGSLNKEMADGKLIVMWEFNNSYVPLLVEKNSFDQHCSIHNILYGQDIQALIKDDDNTYYSVPNITYIDIETLCNLYNYDFDILKLQVDAIDINEHTLNTLNLTALKLISVYDIIKNEGFLSLATYIFDKISTLANNKPYYIINTLQIKFRMSTLDDIDKAKLDNIESDDIQTMCAKYTLLQTNEKAKYFYDNMSDEEKSQFGSFPISKLFTDLTM